MFDLYDPLFMSEEAYFGNDNPFVEEMIKIVTKLDTTMRGVLSERYSSAFRKKRKFTPGEASNIRKIMDEIADCIRRNTNCEKVDIGFIANSNALNMWSIPLIHNDQLFDSHNGKFDDSIAKQIDSITESSKGYRFKKSKGIHLRYGVGIGVFDSRGPKLDLTPRELTAIIFHEIGHSFQHLVGGIYTNLAVELITYILYITNFLEDTNYSSSNLSSTQVRNYLKVSKKLHKAIKSKNPKKIKETMNDKDVIKVYKEIHKLKQKSMGDIETTNNPEIPKEKSTVISNIYLKLILIFTTIFNGILTLLLSPIMLLLTPIRIMSSNKNSTYTDTLYDKIMRERKYLRKDEQFADSFATSYGFGSDLSSAFEKFENYKLSKITQEIDKQSLSSIIVGGKYRAQVYDRNAKMEMIQYAIYGYDTDAGRISNTYKTLEYELRTNKDLSKEEKEEIKKTMEQIKITYEKIQKESKMKTKSKKLQKIQDEYKNKSINEIETDIEDNILGQT